MDHTIPAQRPNIVVQRPNIVAAIIHAIAINDRNTKCERDRKD